ncbi:MAG TPA: hypothetical protein VNO52_04305 [Methylomirabilota bacterium]|nr:hypothetical protein [Methylomirabilota bacterium]
MQFQAPSPDRRPPLGAGPLLALAFLVSGCRPEDIRVYSAPKDKPSPLASTAALPRERPAPPRLEWTLPAGWEEQPAGSMSVASFAIAGAEGRTATVSAMPFPGLVNQDLLVVNILRERSGLPQITQDELAGHTEPVAIGPAAGRLLATSSESIASTNASPLLVAMTTHDNVSWFFRMSGDATLVSEQKPAFLEFLKSVRFVPPAKTAVASTAGGPSPERPAWTVPASWREVAPTSMLLAKFIATGDEGKRIDITVSSLPGDGGGLLTNVNRWRGQVGLAAIDEKGLRASATTLEHPEGRVTVVDLTGTDVKTSSPTRLIAAVMPHHGETWFYKLMGDPQVAEREKAAFLKFVESVNYHAGSPD